MKSFKLTVFSGALLTAGSMFAGTASAALTGTETANVTFSSVGATVYGKSNTTSLTSTYQENGAVVGIVADPTDATSAHLHRMINGTDRSLQYHTDSTGIYVRLADETNFSLKSFDFDLSNAAGKTGNYKIYGFQNAINNPLLGTGTTDPNDSSYYLDDADPEGGLIPHIAEYTLPNDGAKGTLSLSQLLAADADWGNVGAFWITTEGFNNSPNTHYWFDVNPAFPAWDFRIDNIVLGAAVQQPPVSTPVPGAVWLFGTGLAGLIASRQKKATV